MGSGQSKPNSQQSATAQPSSSSARDGVPQGSSAKATGGCPVDHKKAAPEAAATAAKHLAASETDGCPISKKGAGAAAALGGGCPVKGQEANSVPVYNVYGEQIDPKNMMPNANQEPKPGQKYPIDTTRVQSSIPKGGTEGTWLYPSPQMFYNSLNRKGKGDDVNEADVDVIVAIHNNMNERTWKQIVNWEAVYGVPHPKLHRFMGRPDEYSPLARLKYWLGVRPLPFDRHDWYILRDDGSEVRYVIDYYHDEEKSKLDEVPDLDSEDKIKSVDMVVRPALDSPSALLHRMKYGLLGVGATPPLLGQGEEGHYSQSSSSANLKADEEMSVEEMKAIFDKIRSNCGEKLIQLRSSQGEEEQHKAATALNYCMATVVGCKQEVKAFDAAVARGSDKDMEAAFGSISECIERFQQRATPAMKAEAKAKAQAKSS